MAESVVIGTNVTIHAGTVLGEGVTIQDGAIVGKPRVLGSRSKAARAPLPPVVVGPRAVICAGAVIVAGATVGEGAVVGDQAHVREQASIGAHSVVGRGSAVDPHVCVGASVKIQSGVYLAAESLIEDRVFIGPNATTANDPTAGRMGPPDRLKGVVLRTGCRIGAAAVILPGLEVGTEAFVAAGSVVTRDVPPHWLVMGSPARPVRQLDAGDHEEDIR